MFCRETVDQVRQLASSEPNFPQALFFFQETVEQGAAFFAKFWPEARAIADPERLFYDAFAVGQGRLVQMAGPNVWLSGMRALLKGNLAGPATADPWQMPGALLVHGERILWEHRYSHAGEQPDFAALQRLVQQNLRDDTYSSA